MQDNSAPAASIVKTAGASVVVLVLVVGWAITTRSSSQYVRSVQASTEAAAADSAPPSIDSIAAASDTQMATSDIAMVGPAVVGELVAQYQTLKNNNAYTPQAAASVAQQLGENVTAPVPYKNYTLSDIHTSSDTSYEGMLAYRGKLKDALAPLAGLNDLEISVFAKYAETKDPQYLDQLRTIIADYAAATDVSAQLTVPQDAAALHVGILNAMSQFGATLEALADNADDPITVITLLRTNQDAENMMISSFYDLAMYFAHHPKP